ncbi:MAG: hypothetical protein WED07_04860 [Candidatus Freyarchaeum deiterrae]
MVIIRVSFSFSDLGRRLADRPSFLAENWNWYSAFDNILRDTRCLE